MAMSGDLINFDLIEEHKENIQSLPQGRSARALAAILSPLPSGKNVTLEETKTLNDAIRHEYEVELQSIADCDDPVDVFDRYIKWTLNAYPSAQSTPQSQLCPLLERATKAFLHHSEYKNDPRYLKFWLHYIRFFSDTPRETFAFLARHNIGEQLALFYEEFAAWLENAGRWNQAEEVYKLGMEREARPTERLTRKNTQFKQRYDARQIADNEPSSPALPKVRAALAAKLDPYAAAVSEDSQPQAMTVTNPATTKPKKQKMAIFTDAGEQLPPPVSSTTNGWDNIGSMKERKKENTVEARPWAGETLKAGKRVGTASKMEVFKDPNDPNHSQTSRQPELVVNPRTGRSERVFVDMDAVYGLDGNELSFEELRAIHRSWSGMSWRRNKVHILQDNGNAKTETNTYKSKEPQDLENFTACFEQKLDIVEVSSQSQESAKEKKAHKQRKLKIREIKQETQTIKTRLDSPPKPKLKKKAIAEPTMTLHSKAAHNDIYDMYNHVANEDRKDDTQSCAETDLEDDTFSTVGESVDTGRVSTANSEFGDDTVSSLPSLGADDTSSSPWSDFTTGKISKVLRKAKSSKRKIVSSEDVTSNITSSQDQTQDCFDTQAIADIANQDFGELDTMAIARIAEGDIDNLAADEWDDLAEDLPEVKEITPVEYERIDEEPQVIPIPLEDHEPTPIRPYRDPNFHASGKLPFMTPIMERTESSFGPATLFHDRHLSPEEPPQQAESSANGETTSPSKLNVEELSIESPARSDAKRKTYEAENAIQSPYKKMIIDTFLKDTKTLLFPTIKEKEASISIDAEDHNVFRNSRNRPSPNLKAKKIAHKGPIIQDLQCNPCDDGIISQILQTVHPAPSTYLGYHENSGVNFNQMSQIRTFATKAGKQGNKGSPKKIACDKTKLVSPVLRFAQSTRVYSIKRQLGEGAFAPVYLAGSSDTAEHDDASIDTSSRCSVEAIKAEIEPKTLMWEFHVLRLLKYRLGSSSRTMESIVLAHECHLYRDECYLILDYHPQGTLLDLVNLVRSENVRAGKAAEGLEESIVMWLAVELLRTVEDMHKVGILHGDLKADNCLVRLDVDTEVSGPFNRYGHDGWNTKGLTLIDFGRGIDMRAFRPEARFIADWNAEPTDCPEIREAKPWKWEIDLFGVAGVIHSLLFGKYIETVPVNGGGFGQKKEWKLRENLKRYWEKDIWTDVFSVLINGGRKKEDDVHRDLQRIRNTMEVWLEEESERNGRDLRAGLRRCERLVGASSVKGRK